MSKEANDNTLAAVRFNTDWDMLPLNWGRVANFCWDLAVNLLLNMYPSILSTYSFALHVFFYRFSCFLLHVFYLVVPRMRFRSFNNFFCNIFVHLIHIGKINKFLSRLSVNLNEFNHWSLDRLLSVNNGAFILVY
jgi:hypothetical protein